MKIKAYRVAALVCSGLVLGFLPSACESFILNLATPVLLAQ